MKLTSVSIEHEPVVKRYLAFYEKWLNGLFPMKSRITCHVKNQGLHINDREGLFSERVLDVTNLTVKWVEIHAVFT